MSKIKSVLIPAIVCVISLAVGIFLAGKLQKNAPTDPPAASTTSSVSTTEAAVSTTDVAKDTTTVNPTSAQQTSTAYITAEQAKAIALKKAGFDSADVWDKEVEQENENGKRVFEVSFEKNGIDYEYIIDAQSGEILFSEVDPY